MTQRYTSVVGGRLVMMKQSVLRPTKFASILLLAGLFALGVSRSTAQPTCQASVNSLSPSTGPTEGGTTVIITGASFFGCCVLSACPCPGVLFGGVRARVDRCSFGELAVITPPHQPSRVAVSIDAIASEAPVILDGAFTYVGTPLSVPTLNHLLLG